MQEVNRKEIRVEQYLYGIIHEWSKVLATLGFTLFPLYFLLDYFIVPAELLKTFLIYRLVGTTLIILQYFIIIKTKGSRLSVVHGYFISFLLSFFISLMTVDLGGFDSPYYAGLNLVMIGVNLLLPWGSLHTTFSVIIIGGLYLVLNLIFPHPVEPSIMINNLFFITATGIISVAINSVRQKLIKDEFLMRVELKKARDALWGEMKIAKKIQEALLPENKIIKNYSISAVMLPAEEVGGDYYDFLETEQGELWVSIGDVSGHGVESGLITMMTQTSIQSLLNNKKGYTPSELLGEVNRIIKKNITRLKVDRFMTILLLKFLNGKILCAGEHLDIIIYRHKAKKIELFPTEGSWIGLVDNIQEHLKDHEIFLEKNDIMLLYTDGVTEAMDQDGHLYGEERLLKSFRRNIELSEEGLLEVLLHDVLKFQAEQYDDISFMLVKKITD